MSNISQLLTIYRTQEAKAQKAKGNRSKRKEYVAASNKSFRALTELYSVWATEEREVNPEFKRLADENDEILSHLQFKSTAVATRVSMTSFNTAHFSGRIDESGFISAHARTSDMWQSLLNPLGKYGYFSHYSGRIDCLGHFNFTGGRMKYHLFKNLPKHYSTHLSNGRINLFTKELSEGYWKGGLEAVNAIKGFVFPDEGTARTFLANRAKMYLRLEEILNKHLV